MSDVNAELKWKAGNAIKDYETTLLSSTKWKLNYVLIEAETEEIKKEQAYLKIAAPWATGIFYIRVKISKPISLSISIIICLNHH